MCKQVVVAVAQVLVAGAVKEEVGKVFEWCRAMGTALGLGEEGIEGLACIGGAGVVSGAGGAVPEFGFGGWAWEGGRQALAVPCRIAVVAQEHVIADVGHGVIAGVAGEFCEAGFFCFSGIGCCVRCQPVSAAAQSG